MSSSTRFEEPHDSSSIVRRWLALFVWGTSRLFVYDDNKESRVDLFVSNPYGRCRLSAVSIWHFFLSVYARASKELLSVGHDDVFRRRRRISEIHECRVHLRRV